MAATFKSFHPSGTCRGGQLQPEWIRFSLVAVGWLFWFELFRVSDICGWNVDAFSLFFFYSLPAAGNFSVSKIQQSTLEMPPFFLFVSQLLSSHFSGNVKWVFPSHPKPRIFSSRMNVASSMNQLHLPMDLYPFREMEQSLWRRMIHPTWLTVYSVIGEFWLILSVFLNSQKSLFCT